MKSFPMSHLKSTTQKEASIPSKRAAADWLTVVVWVENFETLVHELGSEVAEDWRLSLLRKMRRLHPDEYFPVADDRLAAVIFALSPDVDEAIFIYSLRLYFRAERWAANAGAVAPSFKLQVFCPKLRNSNPVTVFDASEKFVQKLPRVSIDDLSVKEPFYG